MLNSSCPPSVSDLAKQFAAALAETFNVHPIRIKVDIKEDPEPMMFHVGEVAVVRVFMHPPIDSTTPPPLTVPPPPEPQEPASNGQEPKFSPCVPDILAVLEKAKRPLSTTRIMEALAKAGKEHSPRTISEYLSLMVKDGTLDNPADAHPRGYRLPEWTYGED